MTNHEAASRLSLAAAVRHALMQLVRLLEEEDPSELLKPGSALDVALAQWRKTVGAQTSGVSVIRARELEHAKLEMMGRAAQLEKERDDLAERNKELLDQLVAAKKHEARFKQQLVDVQFASSGHKAEAKRLDLEVRELRRRLRQLEGGPPLTAAEAAPQGVADETEAASTVQAEPESKPQEEAIAVVSAPTPVVAPAAAESGPVVIPLSDRRAAAEAAFLNLWKPKETPASSDSDVPVVTEVAESAADLAPVEAPVQAPSRPPRAKTAKVAKATKPAKAAKPVKPAKPAKTAKPAKAAPTTAKSAKTAKPAKAAPTTAKSSKVAAKAKSSPTAAKSSKVAAKAKAAKSAPADAKAKASKSVKASRASKPAKASKPAQGKFPAGRRPAAASQAPAKKTKAAGKAKLSTPTSTSKPTGRSRSNAAPPAPAAKPTKAGKAASSSRKKGKAAL